MTKCSMKAAGDRWVGRGRLELEPVVFDNVGEALAAALALGVGEGALLLGDLGPAQVAADRKAARLRADLRAQGAAPEAVQRELSAARPWARAVARFVVFEPVAAPAESTAEQVGR